MTTAIRPEEHLGQRAMRWTQAQADQQAYRDALTDVRHEAEGYQQFMHGPAGEVG